MSSSSSVSVLTSLAKKAKAVQTPYHVVAPSPTPFCLAMFLGLTVQTFLMRLHFEEWGECPWAVIADPVTVGFGTTLFFALTLMQWAHSLVIEAVYLRVHTKRELTGFRLGFGLFLASEAMLFFPFFWAFFHFGLNPSVEVGGMWPPAGITTVNPWGLPFVNTLILLGSGVTITISHEFLTRGVWDQSIIFLGITVCLGLWFTLLQFIEYCVADFAADDTVYGSIFYALTGLHGFHVLVGSGLLTVALVRMAAGHFTRQAPLGYELAAWYWHFVDFVWILVFSIVYVYYQ